MIPKLITGRLALALEGFGSEGTASSTGDIDRGRSATGPEKVSGGGGGAFASV
jgi:hypothetical protein